jgi:aldose 1-epimerase
MPELLSEIEADGCRAIIDLEHGGRLASLVVHGWEMVATQGQDIYHWGNFVLAPWTGRLRHGRFRHDGRDYRMPLTGPPHALHGLVVDKPWRLVEPGVASVELEDPWPWAGRVIHSIRLWPDRLESRLELHADEAMPAAIGWHPWFPSYLLGPEGQQAGPVELDVEPGRMYVHDAEGVPSGELTRPLPRPWDYCFTDLAAAPRLRWRDSNGLGLELVVESDCPCWVLYDHEPQAIAVEPWTAPPDSLNLPSPAMVTPDAPLVATMTWHWNFDGDRPTS